MKREILLATVALLAMLILVPMAMGQGPGNTTLITTGGIPPSATWYTAQYVYGVGGGETTIAGCCGASGPGGIPTTGGPAIVLPAASLLLGSGILTYAILRRR